MRALRVLGLLLVSTGVLASVCAAGGAIFAAARGGGSYAAAIGWAMWIGGGVVVLLVGPSGSTTRMAGESRIVVGGRFVQGSDIPMPQSPFILIPAGILVVALGVAVYLL